MDKFNQQFATQKLRQETSTTSAGAGMTPSTVNNPVTQDWYTTKNKKKKPKKEGANIPKDFTDAPSIPNRPSKAFVYKQLYEELSKALKEAKGRIHIGTDIKTDSDVYFEPQTGAFYINIIDPAGNRINKLQVNTIEDVLAKFPSWKWTEEGKAEFSGDLDETDATIKKEEVSIGDFNHYRSALNDAYFELTRDGDIKGRDIVANAHKSLEHAEAAEEVINKSSITPGNKATYLKAIAGIKRYLSQPNQKNEGTINETIDVGDRIKVIYGSEFYGETGTVEDIKRGFVIVSMDDYDGMYSMHMSDVEKIEDEDEEDDFYDDYDDEPVNDYGLNQKYPGSYEKEYQRTGKTDFFRRHGGLDESYSKFKNQTKTRGKSDQFHEAIKEVKKKVLEINKMYEYVSRLKEELSEGEAGLEYKMRTEKALHKIKEMVSELNKKIKRFK